MSDRISSTYNFVPVPEKVVYPDWADFVSHDRPFEDGVCGELEIEIKNASPLFIRGKSNQQSQNVQEFFRDGQGQVAIPGTSLRGMLRNVLEIASFGKLDPVNDVRFGLRDLKIPHLYGNHMAHTQRRADNGKSEPMPLVNAGWLKMKENEEGEIEYWIDACHFAKMEYQFLMSYAAKQGIDFRPGNKQSSADKYKALSKNTDITKQEVSMHIKPLLLKGTPTLKGGKRLSEYAEVKPLGDLKKGYLVLTGQPQSLQPGKKNVKHHDFFFYGNSDIKVKVHPDHFRDFEMIHADGAEQHKDEIKGNEEWSFWKKRMKQGQAVPVFFVMKTDEQGNQSLKSFGLAMMFRLAYDLSVGEVLQLTQPSKRSDQQDLAQVMFGYVEKKKLAIQHGLDRNALKGRVSIEQAVLSQNLSPKFTNVLKAVLGGPKASFYPAYIQQGKQPGDKPELRADKPIWKSYMQESEPLLRGWKRYPIRHQPEMNPPIPEKASDKVITQIIPLDQGHTFSCKIHFHNLREIELGALLWIIDFGGASNCFHSLGMAKNLGLGKVQLKVQSAYVMPNDFKRQALTLSEYVNIFQQYMGNQTAQKWAKSNTIRELIACAMPSPTGKDPSHIAQPQLQRMVNGKSSNDFVTYKTVGASLPLHSKATEYQYPIAIIQSQLASQPQQQASYYQFDWNQFEIDVKGETGVVIGGGIPPRPEPQVQAPTPLPETMMVYFMDFQKAREFRQNYDERKKKNKEIKHQVFILKPSAPEDDPRLQKIVMHTEKFEHLEFLLNKIKNSNASIHFSVTILSEVGEDGFAVAGGMIV